MYNYHIIFVVSCLLLSSCAKNITVSFQQDSVRTGTLLLKPCKSTDKTSVSINDQLVLVDKYVKSLTIKNVPEGEYKVDYVFNGSLYKDIPETKMQATIHDGQITTKLIQVPPYSSGFWFYMGGATLASAIVYYVIYK